MNQTTKKITFLLFLPPYFNMASSTATRVPRKRTRQPKRTPPSLTATIISDWINYTLKYSDEGNSICVSLPHFIGFINKSNPQLDEDFELTLKNYGWTPIGMHVLLTKVLFPGSSWKNFLTLNSVTGELTQ